MGYKLHMLALRRGLAGSAFGLALLLAATPSAGASHDPAHPFAGEWKLTLPQGGGGLITFNAVSPQAGQAAVEDNGSVQRGEPCPAGEQYYSGTYWTLAGDRGTHAACGSGSSVRGWYHSSGAANYGAYQMTVSQGSFQGTFNFPWTEPWAPPPPAEGWSGAFSGHVDGDGASAAAGCRKAARRIPARSDARPVNEVKVVRLKPAAEVKEGGEGEWKEVCEGATLKEGDELNVDPDGEVTLEFGDNSKVKVEETTQLKIASFFTEGGVVRTTLLLKVGQVAAKVNKTETTRSDFRIKSPSCAASVRGTDFSARYDARAKATTIWVRQGKVVVDPVKPPLPTVTVGAGKVVVVGRTKMSPVAPIGLGPKSPPS